MVCRRRAKEYSTIGMMPVKFLASVLLGAIVLISVCAYTQTAMSDCPAVQAGVVCPMHRTEGRVLDLAAVGFVVLSVSFVWVSGSRERLFQTWRAFYRRMYMALLPPSPVQELLAQGILHPKIF